MTRFNAHDTTLLLIDHQVGTMQLIHNIDRELVKRNTLALAKMAVILNMPVVLTTSLEGELQGPLLPELEEILPAAFAARVQRTGIVNAWDEPAFRAKALAPGRPNLAMAGVTTDVCLVYPAISARLKGFKVQAILDASGSPFALSEETARRRMENEGVVLTATNTLMAELVGDWSTKEGRQILPILFSEVLQGKIG